MNSVKSIFIFFFYFKKKDHLLQKINERSPPEPCQAINLMVIGTIGSGKSSFINTILTVFRNSPHICTTASPHGINMDSTTRRVSHVKLTLPDDIWQTNNFFYRYMVPILVIFILFYCWQCFKMHLLMIDQSLNVSRWVLSKVQKN